MSERKDLLQDYCLALLKGARVWRRLADIEVSPFGVSEATAYPLVFMSRMKDGMRQSALAEALGIEGPSLVRLLDQLCAADLVQRREDAADKRAKTLHLTARGSELAATLVAALSQARTRVFASVSDDELRTALRVLAALDHAASCAKVPGEVGS